MAACIPPACPRTPRSRQRARLLAALTLMAFGAAPGALAQGTAETSAGGKGAQTYCFMRANGNSHEVSWAAAYALIKRQSGSMFKTSPEHAAVMITEAVVQNPTTYPDCGRYIGDLYARRARGSAAPAPAATTESGASGGQAGGSPGGYGGMTRSERYN